MGFPCSCVPGTKDLNKETWLITEEQTVIRVKMKWARDGESLRTQWHTLPKDLDFYIPTSHEGLLGHLCSMHLAYASDSQP